MATKKTRKSAWLHDPERIAVAERSLRECRGPLRNPDLLLRMLAEGKAVRLQLRSDLGMVANLFEATQRGDDTSSPLPPNAEVFRRLLLF